jgi:hypothetical protein
MTKFNVDFTGPERTSIELQEALVFIHNFGNSLRGGKTEFKLAYEKKDGVAKLVIETVQPEEPKAAEQTETASTSELPPSETKPTRNRK